MFGTSNISAIHTSNLDAPHIGGGFAKICLDRKILTRQWSTQPVVYWKEENEAKQRDIFDEK